MALPAWWQVATPHRDIREKRFSEAIFAADLGDVLGGNAPAEYMDPRLFFSRTYLTGGLKNLVRNVLSRLADGQGDPVIQLQTPFGGGKTHSLLCLYHLARSFPEVNHLEQVKELASAFAEFNGAKAAAFVGTAADPLGGKTPWGEIAYQLGCYEVVKEHDRRRVAPGKERLREILEKSGPALILIDELLEYIVKANRVEKMEKITHGQTLSFLHELSEAVAVSGNCALVLALPASVLEQYDEEAEKALSQIQKVSGRVESIYVPVEGVEIYEVIRKRLLDNCGDKSLHRKVAEAYFKLYQELGSDTPGEIRDVSYREKIEKAYPFHPELIDVLYERWGSFPTFQRTRGVLRLLARVVGDLYERKVSSPLIHSSLVNLANPELRREFIKHIGNEYDSIIASDITGKASRIDQEMGSEYERYSIARGLATSVFLYSFSGGERRGASLPWLRVSLLREGIPSTIVGDAVSKLEDSLWYFHAERRFYSFKNQPNLNRVIVDKEEAVEPEQIVEELRDQLEKLSRGSSLSVYLWPENAGDIPDNKRLKLAIINPEYRYGQKDTDAFALGLAQRAGASPRVYMNSLFFLAVDPGYYITLEKQLRRLLALRDIDSDTSIPLTTSSKEELKTKLSQAVKDMPFHVVNAYRYAGSYGNGEIYWRDMGLPTAGQALTLAGRAYQFLKDEERILANASPKLLLDKAFGKDEMEKRAADCYDLFLKTPGLPCLESEAVFYTALKQGAANDLMGLRQGTRLYFGEAPFEVTGEDIILRPEQAEKEKKAEEEKKVAAEAPGSSTGTSAAGEGWPSAIGEKEDSGCTPGPTTLPPQGVREIEIKAGVPWDKLSQIIAGVILPLKSFGAEPDVTLEIKARCEEGFDRTTLDSKVKETLQQLGAIIKFWDER